MFALQVLFQTSFARVVPASARFKPFESVSRLILAHCSQKGQRTPDLNYRTADRIFRPEVCSTLRSNAPTSLMRCLPCLKPCHHMQVVYLLISIHDTLLSQRTPSFSLFSVVHLAFDPLTAAKIVSFLLVSRRVSQT